MEQRRASNEAFDRFWKFYPRKTAKLAAKREWDKLRPDTVLVEQIMRALSWQAEQWDDPQFIPHPSTWLHQGRWDDEPIQSRQTRKVQKADDYGHMPPCKTRTECIERVVREGREARAQVKADAG